MPPSLLLAWIGPVPLPIPVFLLWPFAALAWGGVWLVAIATGRNPRGVAALQLVLAALEVLRRSRGLRVDVRPQDGPAIRFRLI